jgi:hypothetical protein
LSQIGPSDCLDANDLAGGQLEPQFDQTAHFARTLGNLTDQAVSITSLTVLRLLLDPATGRALWAAKGLPLESISIASVDQNQGDG